jgi:2-polyprenyl-3-methyl-5-hydroxy-6-metoxy-1,4-benzoquinol methylase
VQPSIPIDRPWARATDLPPDYHGHARVEIGPLCPPQSMRVLEVGCGNGATLDWLRRNDRCGRTVGIEIDPLAADDARHRVDRVLCGDAVQLLDEAADEAPFDLLLCLDVLEHLVDPWHFVARLSRLLTPDGVLIASLPNVRHWRVVADLAVRGRWRYRSSGVLDRTHLRFFTRESAIELFDGSGLRVRRCIASRPPRGSAGWWGRQLTLGAAADLFAVQFLLSAQPR